MGAQAFEMTMTFIGVDMASNIIHKLLGSIESMNMKVAASGGGFSKLMNTVGTASIGIGGAILGITAGLAGMGVAAVIHAGKFQDEMVLSATHAGLTRAQVDALIPKILQLSGALGVAPEELAKGLFMVASAGFRDAEMMRVLTTASKEAKMGHATVDDTVRGLTATLKSNVLAFSGQKQVLNDSDQAMAMLNATIGGGQMHLEDLNSAFSTGLLSNAQLFGVGMNEVGGALDVFTNRGVPAVEAATRLRMSFALLGAPTGAALSHLKDLGLTQEQANDEINKYGIVVSKAHLTTSQLATTMRTQGLIPTLKMLREHLVGAGMSTDQANSALANAFGGRRSFTGILTLLQNIGDLETDTKRVGGAANDFSSKWANYSNTFAAQSDMLKQSVNSLFIGIGMALLPAVQGLVHAVLPVVQAIGVWVSEHSALIGKIAPLVIGIGAIVGGGLVLGGTIMLLIGAFNPLSVVIIGVIAVVAILATHWKEISQFFQAHVAPVIKQVAGHLHELVPPIQKFVEHAEKLADGALKKLEPLLAHAGQLFKDIGDAVGPVTTGLKDIIDQTLKWTAPLRLLVGDVLKGLAQAFMTTLPHAIEILKAAFTIVFDVLQVVVAVIKFVFQVIDDIVHGHWGDIWKHFTELVKKVGPILLDILRQLWVIVLNVITGLVSGVLKLAEGLWHGVINFFTKLWHDGVETVTQMVGGVLKWIEKLVTDGLKFFGDLKTRALNLIMSWVILMVAHAEHLVGQIGEKLGQLPGKVLGILGDLKTKAVDGLGTVATSALTAAAGIGKSIVDGITSGLRNAWHTITSTLSGLASNLPGPIKSALGISSPSKVFAHHIGGPIAHGIAHGITQHAHHVGLAAHNAALHGLHQARQAANSAMQHHRPAHHGGFKKGHVPWNKGKHPGTTHTSGGGSLSGGESAAQEKAESQLADKTYQVLVRIAETLDSILKVEESNGGSATNGAHVGHKEISGQTQQTLDTLGWAMIERAQYARTRGLQGEILAP